MKNIKKGLCFLAILLAGNAYGQLWKQYADSAKTFEGQQKTNKAVEYYERAIGLVEKDSLRTANYAQVITELGAIYGRRAQHSKAESLFLEAKKIWEEVYGKEHRAYAESCNNLGIVYRMTGQYTKAESFLLEGKEIRQRVLGKDNIPYAQSCNSLGYLYKQMGNYLKAETFLLESKNIAEKVIGKESPVYGAASGNLANLYRETGQYQRAEAAYIDCLECFSKISGKESANYASSMSNLANLYREIGQYEKAEAGYLTAISLREKLLGKEHPEYTTSCENLAILYATMGQIEKAELLLQQVKDTREKVLGKKHPSYAMACCNLAGVYAEGGKYDMAQNLYTEAKDVNEKSVGKNHLQYINSCNSLGLLFVELNEYEKAESLLLEVKQLSEKVLGKKHLNYAENCSFLGGLYKMTGQYEKSVAFYMEARNIVEEIFGKEAPEYMINSTSLGNVYRVLNRLELANSYYGQAFESHRARVKEIFKFTNEDEQFSYLEKNTNLKKYILSASLSTNSLNNQDLLYDISLANRNLILSSSQQLRKIIFNAGDTAMLNKYTQWIELREQISFWSTRPLTERPGYLATLEEKSNLLEKELTRFSSAFKQGALSELNWKKVQDALKTDEAAIEFSSFQYYNGNNWTDSTYYVALVLRKDNSGPRLIKLFEERELSDLLKVYKGTSAGQYQANYLYVKRNKGYKDLYDLIWKPIETKLQGIKTVYFAPAGNLYKISFGALPVNDKEVLGDKYRFVQLNTTASVIDQARTVIASSENVVLYGGIQYDIDSTNMKLAAMHSTNKYVAVRSFPDEFSRDGVPEFKYLNGAEKEISGISKLAGQMNYDVKVSEGKNATEESFKTLTGTGSPSVIHIATHGFFFPDPRTNKKIDKPNRGDVFRQSDNPLIRSGLALAGANNAWKGKPVAGVEDGILTAYEVSNMYLPNTKLAVLSACETGLGDIQGSEGVYGLQRAFKMAGVENLVMSLWKVPDGETAEFMQQFYKNLFAGQTIQDAFYKAQTTMKSKYRKEPFKWAAWVLIR